MSTNKRIDPAIIAALIGVMGTICVTVLTLIANNYLSGTQPQATDPGQQPTWTAPATSTVPPTATITNTPQPTDTVPAGNPTSTPAPETPTPEPTFTPVPPAIGADWVNNCISVLWRPFPDLVVPTAGNGCYAGQINFPESFNALSIEGGHLKFLAERSVDNPQVYGLFAPLPANGTVRIDTLLRRAQDGEIWIGIFAEPNLTSQGLVAALPSGENVRNRPLVQKKMPEQVEIHRLENFTDDPTQDPPQYSIVFELMNGEVRIQKLSVSETEFSAVPLGTAQPWLFVGYQLAAGNNRLEGEFLNLLVQPQ
jgi:hypothetical protein